MPLTMSGPSTPVRRQGHSRSSSNPFASIVGRRKSPSKSRRSHGFHDSDSDDCGVGDIVIPIPGVSGSSPKRQLHLPPDEVATGRCVTCNSTVRWPRSLRIFRCTVCLTVNDLDPTSEEQRHGKLAAPRAISTKVPRLTVENTKAIMESCMLRYLEKVLESPVRYFSGYNAETDREHGKFGPGANERQNRPSIFRPLEEYIMASFRGCDCLNCSFTAASAGPSDNISSKLKQDSATAPFTDVYTGSVSLPDAKMLLLGDLTENSSWWMNDWAQTDGRSPSDSRDRRDRPPNTFKAVSYKSPRIDWAELAQWYQTILTAGTAWIEIWSAMRPSAVHDEEDIIRMKQFDSINLSSIDREVTDARLHLQRTLLSATENLLKRPRRPIKKPDEVRFLLIILANPMIYPSNAVSMVQSATVVAKGRRRPSNPRSMNIPVSDDSKSHRRGPSNPLGHQIRGPGQHSSIIKRVLGLIAHLPDECHHYLVSWFSRYSARAFEQIVDLFGSFITYRMTRQHGRKRSESVRDDGSLIPSFSSSDTTPAELHAALHGRPAARQDKEKRDQPVIYDSDWQIQAAARVMALLFAANTSNASRQYDGGSGYSKYAGGRRKSMIPISSFYNTLLDYSDLMADFEAWESRSSKFSFCQYPFLLSIWAKIHVLEHDARRQMEVKAREAFFSSILGHKAVSQYFVLKVRRDCLVEDSLRRVSEVIGSNQEEMKKGLRIEFTDEEGVDAGGLRKEWFLLLVREIFEPEHGLFIYDEDSRYCYFNPYCFESSEQFFLVGVLLGLAIYNSTILDIALPPFAFKKLLMAAPQTGGPQTSVSRPAFKCTLDDLAEYRPALARGLRCLLDFEGDVAETFCQDFVVHINRYGEVISVPLCPGGEKRSVTNSNRREFVDLYVHYVLDLAVTRQFEPFKRGFFTVCGGNALSLFRPEEIELLVRGSDEPLDVASLRAVATYDNWADSQPESVPVIQWFWNLFEKAEPQMQRKILSFITGGDRIPAMGATSLIIRLMCLGDDSPRYPIARTCFNTLGLYRYQTQEKLERMLCDAVANSEGFGLK